MTDKATKYDCDEIERLLAEKQADRMAIAKALALVQYIEDAAPLLALFVVHESAAFREASEAIRGVLNFGEAK